MDLSDLAALVDSGALEVTTHPNDLVFAGDRLDDTTIKYILTKWEDLDIDSSRPNYEGRDGTEWVQDNNRIRNLLLENPSEGRAILRANGFDAQESKMILKDLRKDNTILRNQAYATAHAKADEDISRAVLHYSGYAPVKEGNAGNVQATDLSMSIPGRPGKVMVDAQVRATPRGLNLGIAQGYNSVPALYRAIRNNPDRPIIELIKEASMRRAPITEDKLLQTKNKAFNPIQSIVGTSPENRKDFIISSNRPDAERRGAPRGPYNRERAMGWDLIDLDRTREILLPKSYNQIADFTDNNNPIYQRGKKLIIQLPNDIIRNELTNRKIRLERDAVKAFTGGIRVKR